MSIRDALKSVLKRPLPLVRAGYLRIRMARLEWSNRFSRSAAVQPPGEQPQAPVVSLTTYGIRIATVHLAIESIAKGSLRPSRLILWLDEASALANLPEGIRRLEARGLEVKFSRKNFGPHKKYYPYVESEEVLTVPLATADDDVAYPKHWLRGLLEAFQRDPGTVNCYRARIVTLRDSALAPYGTWPECKSVRPSFLHFATGVSGTIYPPRVLVALKNSGTAFESCCLMADDIWLHAHALRTGHRIRQVTPRALLFPRLPGTQETALKHGNVMSDSGNDRQAKLTYTDADLQVLRSESCPDGEPRIPAPGLRDRIRMAWHAVIYG